MVSGLRDASGPACTPGSVPGRCPFDGHLSRRHVAVPLQRSTRGLGEPRQHPLSDLAPGEVYLADRVTTTPGGLLHHPFTLTPCGAVYSLWHCLADYSGWVLPTALPFGARTFLGAVARNATVWPTHSSSIVSLPRFRFVRTIRPAARGCAAKPTITEQRARRMSTEHAGADSVTSESWYPCRSLTIRRVTMMPSPRR